LSPAAWDLTALLNAAPTSTSLPERHLWLVRLMEWLRQAPVANDDGGDAAPGPNLRPLLRLRRLLGVLEQHDSHRRAVQALLGAFWRDIDAASLFADFGFGARMALRSELWKRVRERVLPASPVTRSLAEFFPLLVHGSDAAWLAAIDEPTLERLAALLLPHGALPGWREPLLDAQTTLAGTIAAVGLSAPLRQRMDRALLAEQPFRQLTASAERLRAALRAEADDEAHAAALREAAYLRALLDRCRAAAASVREHLEEFGVSVDIVYETDQLRARTLRLEHLLDCLLAQQPARGVQALLVELAHAAGDERGLRPLMARHYSQLARQVTERNAETGEHYIARDAAAYRGMLERAAIGGSVMAGTVFAKFGIFALGLTAFWAGFFAGINYATSFVLIMLLHGTVATKQPAMTAPALAARLREVARDGNTDGFVDEVAYLARSQSAGILGNLALCAPLVLAGQLAAQAAFGAPLVSAETTRHSLHALTLLGPTALYAAFTGVLLFASSIFAGYVENWFVFHRLDSAIAWNPRIVGRLGRQRAQRWAGWWRDHVSGLAANVSLGLMLGLVPAIAAFFALPIDVRHVTLSTGQVAAALGAEGASLLGEPVFWWCVAGIAVTGLLNVTVSFVLAFRLALRARGIRTGERARLYAAVRQRLLRRPLSFLLPVRG
jgi:site-specific recombinase